MQETKRNDYIDFVKGIAALCIIAIHTSFWSGQYYTPEWFYNMTLFVDVPLFYYLSGWGSSYRKSDIARTARSLGRLWLQWIFFITVLEGVCVVSRLFPTPLQGVGGGKALLNAYMFNVSMPSFQVVGGSTWFLNSYFVVIPCNVIVMMLIQRSSRAGEYKRLYAALLCVAFLWVYFGKYLFNIDSSILFYSWFWMLGQIGFAANRSARRCAAYILLAIAGILVATRLQGVPLYDIQSGKFPPSPKYACVSLISLIVARMFEPHVKRPCRALVHIGRNALFYFFAQGVGSSLLFHYVSAVSLEPWPLKWIIALCLNIAVTAAIAETLAFAFRRLERAAKRLRQRSAARA